MFLQNIVSLGFWSFGVLSSILLFPVALTIWAVTAPFDRRKVVLHRFTCFWASLYTWLSPFWKIRIHGREKIRPGQTYVMVANHQSLLDILVLFRLFRHYKWVSKIENFRIPLIGWNMTLNGYIKLRRGDRRSVEEMMRRCEEVLKEGSSIMIFPEGTRSPDGRVRRFKPGAFLLAQRAGVPILPILIRGTSRALPKRGFILQGHHDIEIQIMDEIPYDTFRDRPAEEFASEVHAFFKQAIEAPEKLPA